MRLGYLSLVLCDLGWHSPKDVVIQDIAFDCAVTHFSTPQVLGEQDDTVTPVITPVVATPAKVLATTTPSELPATGGENNYLVLGIALSMATYYIAFRRQEA